MKKLLASLLLLLSMAFATECSAAGTMVTSVPTIAALRLMAVPASAIGSLVYVNEYTTNYVTGGGWFTIKYASCTDDHGYKILLQGNHCAWRNGVEAGFKSTDFGANAVDTTIDSATALNDAVAATCAANSPTRTLWVPTPNSYYKINAAPIGILCNLRMVGLGNVLFFCTNAALPSCMNNAKGATISPTIENLSFETNAAIPIGIYMKGWSGAVLRNVGFPKELPGSLGFLTPIRVEATDAMFGYGNTFYNIGVRTKCDANAIGVNLLSTATTVNSGITTEKFFGGEVDSCGGTNLKSDGGIQVFGTIFEETGVVCIDLVNAPAGISDNIGSSLVGAYFEACGTTVRYGTNVYWNSSFGSGEGTIFTDNNGRNLHLNNPYATIHAERLVLPVNAAGTAATCSNSQWITQNTLATSYTGFCGGVGTEVKIGIFDAHTTIVNGGAISTASGSNITSGYHTFFNMSGTWYEIP
jgi:hypothetical protein